MKRKKLSAREQEVYNLLIDGKSRKDIMNEMCIAKGTLDFHIMHIFKKKNVKNRLELVAKHYEVQNDF